MSCGVTVAAAGRSSPDRGGGLMVRTTGATRSDGGMTAPVGTDRGGGDFTMKIEIKQVEEIKATRIHLPGPTTGAATNGA
jgi:hypothetical protein